MRNALPTRMSMAAMFASAVLAAAWFAWSAIFKIDESGQMDRGVQANELTGDEIDALDLSVPEAPLGSDRDSR